MKELPVPDGLPERLKERLRLENEKIRAKQKLIEEEVTYSEETINIFNNYVKDFQTLYPGVLSDEEILKRLKANIKQDIRFAEIRYKNKDDKGLIGGVFNSKDHSVTINSLYYDSLKDKRKIKAVIFHELTHALVENNPYDDERMHEFYECQNFITEAIGTIMEEDYMRDILGIKVRRVNNYLPTYAHELRAIFGDDLIKEYIRNFKRVDDLFKRDDEYISCAYDLIPMMDDVYYSVKENIGGIDVYFNNKTIELGIALLLDHKLSKSSLTEEEKLDNIIQLATLQKKPDFNVYQQMIKKHIKNMSLIENNKIAKLLYYKENINKDFVSDAEYANMNIKLSEFNVCGLYGANEFFKYDPPYDTIYRYRKDKVKDYCRNKGLYKVLYDALEDGYINEEDLKIKVLYKTINRDKGSYIGIKEQLDYDISDIDKNIHDAFYGGEELYKCRTRDKRFCVHIDANRDLLFAKSTEDAILEFLEEYQKETDRETKEGLEDAVLKLKALKEEGIEEVYSNGYKFIYKKDDIMFVNRASYYTDENGVEHGIYKENKMVVKKVAPPIINMSSKII